MDVRGRRGPGGRRRARARHAGVQREDGRRHDDRRRLQRRDAPAPALRLPAAQEALLALHAGDGRARLRHPARDVPRDRRDADRQLGARAHDRARLRRQLDAAQPRRADDPRRRDRPAAARQHRAPGRRHHGDARPRVDPGLERHPHALRPAPRLPADAQGLRGRPHARELHRGGRLPARLVEQLRQVHRRAAEGLVRAQRDGGERLRLRPPAEDLRQPLPLPDDAARPRRPPRRDVRDGPEPRRRLTALGAAAACARRAQVARGARPRRGRVGALLARLAGGQVGRARHGGDPDGGLPHARRRAHREGGPLHQHPAAPAVARQGARPAGRRALRAALHAPPRQARAGALRGLRGPEGLAAAQPALGLRGARAAPRAVRRGRAEGDRRLRGRDRAAAERLHGDRGRRQDRLRVLDLRRLLRRRRQPAAPARPREPRRPGGRLGLARVGLGVAGQPAAALQPRVGRPAGQAVVGAQEVRLVGRGAGQVDRLRRPGLPGRQAPRLRGGGRRRGHGRDLGRRPVHHDGRRAGLAVLPERPAGRADADALRAVRVAGREPALPEGGREPRRAALGPRRQPDRPAAGPALPRHRLDLPAHGAAHLRPDEPQPAVARRAAAGDVHRARRRARGRARDRGRRLGDGGDRTRRDRGAGEGDAPAAAAPDRRPHDPPDLPAVALGALHDQLARRHRRLRQRPRPAVRRPQRLDRGQDVRVPGARRPPRGRVDGAARGRARTES